MGEPFAKGLPDLIGHFYTEGTFSQAIWAIPTRQFDPIQKLPLGRRHRHVVNIINRARKTFYNQSGANFLSPGMVGIELHNKQLNLCPGKSVLEGVVYPDSRFSVKLKFCIQDKKDPLV